MKNHNHDDPYTAALKKVKSHESAKEGARHWMIQRLVSLVLVPLVIWAVGSIILLGATSYEDFTKWLSNPVNTLLAILFMSISIFHGVLGNQEIIEDYVTHEKLKRIKLIGQKIFFFTLGVISIASILKIAFFA